MLYVQFGGWCPLVALSEECWFLFSLVPYSGAMLVKSPPSFSLGFLSSILYFLPAAVFLFYHTFILPLFQGVQGCILGPSFILSIALWNWEKVHDSRLCPSQALALQLERVCCWLAEFSLWITQWGWGLFHNQCVCLGTWKNFLLTLTCFSFFVCVWVCSVVIWS